MITLEELEKQKKSLLSERERVSGLLLKISGGLEVVEHMLKIAKEDLAKEEVKADGV